MNLGNLESMEINEEKDGIGFTFLAGPFEFFVPAGDNVNVEEEIAKLQKDLEYQKGFFNSVNKKLANERFVNNAPDAVVNAEKQKREDAESKIKVLEERIAALS